MIKKTLTLLAVSCMMYSCATKTESNPFFAEFQTEYGVPSFDKIKLEHYEPAFLKGIEEQNQTSKLSSKVRKSLHSKIPSWHWITVHQSWIG